MSSLLYDVVCASRCRGFHQKLALDALRFVRGEAAGRWCQVFLNFSEAYLAGATAPDDLFRDAKNHVLYVGEKNWGGAISAAERWFHRTADAFQRQSWEEGVYSAGVLSHYISDVFSPLHTAQSEAGNAVHRAFDESLGHCYGELQQILEHDLSGYPEIEAPDGDEWLGELLIDGARRANAHYETILEHYDLRKGAHDPGAGMDQELKDAMARLVGRAAVGFGRVLEIVFEEADVLPPEMDIAVAGFIATLQVPQFKFSRMIAEAAEQWRVRATAEELQRTGKVLQTLAETEHTVRRLYVQEVLQQPIARLDAEPAGDIGVLHGEGTPPRTHSNRLMTRRPTMRPPEKDDPAPPLRVSKPATASNPVKPAVADTPVALPAKVETPPAKPEKQPPVPAAPETKLEPSVSSKAAVVRLQPQQPVSSAATMSPPASAPAASASPPVQKPSAAMASPPVRPSQPMPQFGDLEDEFTLELSSPVANAPSIGPKTAERLSILNVATVNDLLGLMPETAAAKLQSRFITADVLRDWQSQATLACSIPGLRPEGAQILVACGIREPSQLVGLDVQAVCSRVDAFCGTAAGERVLRNAPRPTPQDVAVWIDHARFARPVRAA